MMKATKEEAEAMLLRFSRGDPIEDTECFDAIDAFRTTQLPEWQLVLEYCRNHSSDQVRLWSFYTLSNGDWARPEYLEFARQWLDDKTNRFHTVAVSAIMRLSKILRTREAVPDLLRVVRDPVESARTRMAAYDALVSIFQPPGVRRLPPEIEDFGNPDKDIDWSVVTNIEESLGSGS